MSKEESSEYKSRLREMTAVFHCTGSQGCIEGWQTGGYENSAPWNL